MKNRPIIACLMLSFSFTASSLADMGELTEPSLAFPADFPAAARTKALAVLLRPDCEFRGCTWLNAWSFLNYGGETLALNRFLEGLAQCPGISLSISFHKFSDAEKLDWSLEHYARLFPDKVVVRVNLNSSRIKLADLVLPDTKDSQIADFVGAIRGKPGTKVTVTLKRKDTGKIECITLDRVPYAPSKAFKK